MNLKHLKDSELLSQTKQLVQTEREVLTKVLHHLREVDRRKLFSDLGYQSLFEYAVKDLKYGEGQAGRRIQAMRLIKEIPELEQKIESGDLSLSNISQAQSYFREAQKTAPQMKMDSSEKLKVLKSLENKSVREGQKVLISLQPQAALPRERERILNDSHVENTFVKSEELNKLLEEVRSLLGSRGANMSLAELIGQMAKISIRKLKEDKFGKKRTAACSEPIPTSKGTSPHESGALRNRRDETPLALDPIKQNFRSPSPKPNGLPPRISNSEIYKKSSKRQIRPKADDSRSGKKVMRSTPAPELKISKNQRYIPGAVRYEVWNRDQGKCRICNSKRYLNFDHIKPIALGGLSTVENLRLLCSQCNQRQAIKVFGADRISTHSTKAACDRYG